MTPAIVSIPIAILIFDNDGQIIYKAFSPAQYHTLGGPISEDDNTFPDQFGQFLARVYNHISYDALQTANNTQHGKLKEVHTRMINIPLVQRTNMCYFSTYTHPHTTYKPVHKTSPVFFDFQAAASYANSVPALIHLSCSHEFV